MLSKLQAEADNIISKTIGVPSRRLSDFVKGLSNRSLQSTNSQICKKERHVHFGKRTVHIYPAAESMVPAGEIWHNNGELETGVSSDLAALRKANTSCNVEDRGLEFYLAENPTNHKRMTQLYVRSVVQRCNESTNHSSSKEHILLKQRLRKSSAGIMDNGLLRYPLHQVPDRAEEVAFRLACEDEVEARKIYLQDGTVECSSVFAAKSAGSVKAKATAATTAAQQRLSFIARSA